MSPGRRERPRFRAGARIRIVKDRDNGLIKVDTWGYPVTCEIASGSELLQQRIGEDNTAELEECRQKAQKEKSETQRRIRAFLYVLGTTAKRMPGVKRLRKTKGEVDPRAPVSVKQLQDHYTNEFSKYMALTSATLKVNKATYEGILGMYLSKSEARLTAALKDAEAAVYDNNSQKILRGGITLEERILEIAEVIIKSKTSSDFWGASIPSQVQARSWTVPDITWVNGVPCCRKTKWVVKYFVIVRDVVITTTLRAARDLRENLASQLRADAISKVRTMASVLVNGFRGTKNCDRLIVKEALMSHFEIIMTTRLAGAKQVLLMDKVNQLLFITR
ncbi:hypothetical protein EVAR_88625_1 [Eumeta japonica]|uniref:Uncharacterized protein n=1 Tax=Eumeta variegata TaxID=151549 RepID=A0A4C1WZM7_EUMVA|nr:hypothetical protein EVAR_88625_1 [Eumeta japonica]